MWGQHWNSFNWGGVGVVVPTLTATGLLLLGCVIGALGVLALRSPRKLGLVALILALLVPLSAIAGVPFTFTNGTVADASQVNANFKAVTPIIGSTSTGAGFGAGGGGGTLIPSSPAFTAPRDLTCLVTTVIAGFGGPNALFTAQPVVKIGATTSNSGPTFFLPYAPTTDVDFAYNGTLANTVSVPSGSAVSFGATVIVSGGGSTVVNVQVISSYYCGSP
jgi:hypothetical protein